jgi:O-antigen/teichoic acid export membrane protein
MKSFFLQSFPKLDSHLREILEGASVTFALRSIGIIFTFGFNLMLARMIGPDGTGLFFLSVSIITVASVISRMGFDNAVLRFAAEASVKKDWGALIGLFKKSTTLCLATASLLMIMTFACAPWLADVIFQKPPLAEPLRWMTPTIPAISILFLHTELLKGLKKIKLSQIIQGTCLPVATLMMCLFFGIKWELPGIAAGYAASAILMACLAAFAILRFIQNRFSFKGFFSTRKLFRTGIPLYNIALMNLILTWSATIILGTQGRASEIGLFQVANLTAMLIGFFLTAINTIAAPKFASLYVKKEMQALSKSARQSSALMVIAVTPLLVLMILYPASILRLFGPEFEAGAPLLRLMSIGQFINVATGSVGYLLMMTGYERLLRFNITIATVINLWLCIWLIPKMGALGAAIATAVPLALLNILSAYFVYNRLHIVTIPFLPVKYENDRQTLTRMD